MKGKRILLSAILIAIIAVLLFSTKAFAIVFELETDSGNISIDGDSYFIGGTDGKPIFRIKNRNDASDTSAFYCLSGGIGFGSSTGSISYVNYGSSSIDIFANKEQVKTALGITDRQYNAIAWLIDNIYLPKQYSTTETKNSARSKFLGRAYTAYNIDTAVLADGKNDHLIEIVQQLVLWNYTNNKSNDYITTGLGQITISGTSLSNMLKAYAVGEYGHENYGIAIYNELEAIYKYLNNGAQNAYNNGYTHQTTSEETKEIKIRDEQHNIKLLDSGTTLNIGPFHLDTSIDVSKINKLQVAVVNQNNTSLAWAFADNNGTSSLGMSISDIINNEFYINITNMGLVRIENIESIKLSINYEVSDTKANLYTLDGEQPIVEIDKVVIPDDDEAEVKMPQFDLALRKNIVSITKRDGTILTETELGILGQLTRTPNVDASKLNTKESGKIITTAEYKHRKDAIQVEPGYIVEYAITVYNEGSIAGRATEIIDYLPDGLTYVDGSGDTNYNFSYDAINKKITITPKSTNTRILNAYNGTTLDKVQIKFKCKVETNAKGIITNYAEITKAENELNLADRDSTPGSPAKPTNLSNYTGNGNKSDLTDSTYFYKGQEDDDDFEKLKVVQFDLALRKYITKVTRGTDVLSIAELGGRTPNINTSSLSGGTTAEYKHRKDPVPVQTGDIVEYKITIYNEGDIAGRATKIVDHLPEGLEYVSADTTNYTFSISTDKRTITIIANSDYKHNLNPYNGGSTLDQETITLTCRVTKKEDRTIDGDTILTNIAEITEAYNDKDQKMYLVGDDRDSEPGNVTIPADTTLPDYKGNGSNKSDLTDSTYFYKGQQDDDDFEKLKVTTPEYDLALRKFITHINGKEVESRVPVYDTTPLKNYLNGTGNKTTAIYTHSKNPLVVKIGATVTYTIRVYNEGSVDGYPEIIQDYLPEELELVPLEESTINSKYGWSATGRIVTTQYLNGTIIRAYDGGNTLDYKDVEIECRVKPNATTGKILTNIAQIVADNGDDRDSDPSRGPIVSDADLPNYADHQEDDDDYEKVVIYQPGYDLALRKFITHINGEQVTPSREPIVDVTDLKNEDDTTAKYTHPKNPITVNVGDKVVYKIRVYNEGETDGTATVIEDYLPEELELVPLSESEINTKYNWSGSGRVITTTYLADKVISAYDGGDELDYEDVEVECKIKEGATAGKILTNIAQINGDDGNDRDSQPGNVTKPSDANLPKYVEHQQDDDDYEKVKVYQPNYDLALRKFITKVNDKEITDRIPVVDVSKLNSTLENGEEITTATYTHPKNPLLVRNGDIVIYTIRVYNEGKFDGYAEEIKDNIPEGLAYIIDNDINIEYRWKLSDDQKTISTDYLSKERYEENVIKAFDSATMDTLDYKDVKIAFKVMEPNTSTRILTNIAEIKEDDGDDIDSTPNNNKEGEDDIDVEHVQLRYFDLALRKFITKVESKNGENLPIETDTTKDVSREPKVEIDEEGNIKYIHPKDPVVVANSDIVIYTLRVYNEGTIDGYAEEIKDDVPVGLELVLDHEINTKYGWVMYDADGNVTNDVTKAKTIRSTYLSQEKDENNIIRAFDRDTMQTPDYKEVQVAFKVVEKNVGEERVVINTAEISKDSDDDEDSIPDNDKENEDDIDKEYIKLKYFDLSLLKWVSKVSVTRNGKTEVTETGYNGLEDPEPLVKTEIKSSEIKTIVVKYEYGIKITNEGQIPGYAKEVADYIPAGLEFIPEDNPLWTVKEDGKIVTTQLEDTLLQPGESAIITVVFKWKNNENNFGVKENVAEISKDYNDKESEDIDSTPDNKILGEDDIDNAFVILNPKTGGPIVFIILPTAVLSIISAGVILIKKYVM